MNKPHKHAEVLRAIADGKDVQILSDAGWVDCDLADLKKYHDPITCFDSEWRIKPEPKPDVVKLIGFIVCNGSNHAYIHDDYSVVSHWDNILKITIDGETKKPKSVELIK